MQKFDALIPLAEQEIARLIAKGNKARDGGGKKKKQSKKQDIKQKVTHRRIDPKIFLRL